MRTYEASAKTVEEAIELGLQELGVSIGAVAESLREAIKYKVEGFTGMIVDTVNVNVIGVKL